LLPSSVAARTEIVLPQNSVTNMSETCIFRPEMRILFPYLPFRKIDERKYRTRVSATSWLPRQAESLARATNHAIRFAMLSQPNAIASGKNTLTNRV
jgi:hypothetical protein